MFGDAKMMRSLPPTIEKLISEIRDVNAEGDVISYAEILGAIRKCSICHTVIVDRENFARAAVDAYKVNNDDTNRASNMIESSLVHCAIETGGWVSGSLCASCADSASKD